MNMAGIEVGVPRHKRVVGHVGSVVEMRVNRDVGVVLEMVMDVANAAYLRLDRVTIAKKIVSGLIGRVGPVDMLSRRSVNGCVLHLADVTGQPDQKTIGLAHVEEMLVDVVS